MIPQNNGRVEKSKLTEVISDNRNAIKKVNSSINEIPLLHNKNQPPKFKQNLYSNTIGSSNSSKLKLLTLLKSKSLNNKTKQSQKVKEHVQVNSFPLPPSPSIATTNSSFTSVLRGLLEKKEKQTGLKIRSFVPTISDHNSKKSLPSESIVDTSIKYLKTLSQIEDNDNQKISSENVMSPKVTPITTKVKYINTIDNDVYKSSESVTYANEILNKEIPKIKKPLETINDILSNIERVELESPKDELSSTEGTIGADSNKEIVSELLPTEQGRMIIREINDINKLNDENNLKIQLLASIQQVNVNNGNEKSNGLSTLNSTEKIIPETVLTEKSDFINYAEITNNSVIVGATKENKPSRRGSDNIDNEGIKPYTFDGIDKTNTSSLRKEKVSLYSPSNDEWKPLWIPRKRKSGEQLVSLQSKWTKLQNSADQSHPREDERTTDTTNSFLAKTENMPLPKFSLDIINIDSTDHVMSTAKITNGKKGINMVRNNQDSNPFSFKISSSNIAKRGSSNTTKTGSNVSNRINKITGSQTGRRSLPSYIANRQLENVLGSYKSKPVSLRAVVVNFPKSRKEIICTNDDSNDDKTTLEVLHMSVSDENISFDESVEDLNTSSDDLEENQMISRTSSHNGGDDGLSMIHGLENVNDKLNIGKDPAIATKEYERQLSNRIRDLIDNKAIYPKDSIINLIQSGISKYNPIYVNNNVSATNDICSYTNFVVSNAFFYQQTHRKDRLKLISINHTLSEEYKKKMLISLRDNDNKKKFHSDRDNKHIPLKDTLSYVKNEGITHCVPATKDQWKNEWRRSLNSSIVFFESEEPENIPNRSDLNKIFKSLRSIFIKELNCTVVDAYSSDVDIHILRGNNSGHENSTMSKSYKLRKQGRGSSSKKNRTWSLMKTLRFLENLGIDVDKWEGTEIFDISNNSKLLQTNLDLENYTEPSNSVLNHTEDAIILKDLELSTPDILNVKEIEKDNYNIPDLLEEKKNKYQREDKEIIPLTKSLSPHPETVDMMTGNLQNHHSPEKEEGSSSKEIFSIHNVKYLESLLENALEVLSDRNDALNNAEKLIGSLSNEVLENQYKISSLSSELNITKQKLKHQRGANR